MIKEQPTIKEQKKDNVFILLLSLFVLSFLFLCSKMSPLYPSNEWSDVNIYETIGRAIVTGKTLYVDIFDHKGPLIFIIYGLAYILVPYKFVGMFIILSLLWITVLIHLFHTLSKYIAQTYAVIICTLTCYFSLNYMHTGGSPEEFILLAYIYILSVSFRLSKNISDYNSYSIKKRESFCLGLFSSMILLLKFNLILFYFFLLVGIFLVLLQSKRYKAFYSFIIYYLIGFSILMLAVLAFLYFTDALQATIDTYIILNKKMVSSGTFMELFRLGTKRIIELFQYHLLGTILLGIGAFIFPFIYLKSNILKACFILAVISTTFILYYTGVAHFYYTLPLYCLVPFGLFTIFAPIAKKVAFRNNILVTSTCCLIILVLSVFHVNFWDLSFRQLSQKEQMPGVNYQFAKVISSRATDPTLLVLSFGDAINVFTLCSIVPDIKYFSILNIDYETYPALRNYQKKLIDNKDVEFIILNEGSSYFNTYEPLLRNYSIVDTFEGYEEYQNVKIPKRTFLYQRN